MSIIKNVFVHLFGWSFVGIDDIDAALPRFLVFTRDGKSLVSAGHHKVVRIWDIASGKTVRTIRGRLAIGRKARSMRPPFRRTSDPDASILLQGDMTAAQKQFIWGKYSLSISGQQTLPFVGCSASTGPTPNFLPVNITWHPLAN